MLNRRLYSLSVTYRAFFNYRSREQLKSYRHDQNGRGVGRLVPGAFHAVNTREGIVNLDLPTRVSNEERQKNFRLLKNICEHHGIRLVIIHPSYRDSVRHECELTDFCRETKVPMFEAFDSLHPPGGDSFEYFLDLWHPSPLGHREESR